MNYMEFTPISLDFYQAYEKIRRESPVSSADYTFTNLWGWADLYGLSIAIKDTYAIIHQKYPHDCFWAPVGDWYSMDFEEIFSALGKTVVEMTSKLEIPSNSGTLSGENPSLENHSGQNHSDESLTGIYLDKKSDTKKSIEMHRVPKELVDIIQNTIKNPMEIIETRGQWEYLYNREDLVNLSGNRFHKKKNHVNTFHKTYGEDYRMFDATEKNVSIIEDVLLLQEEWCRWRDCENSPSLQAENDVIFRVVGNWEKLGNLVGGALYVEDTIVAFSIGERLDKDTFVVHFEKTQSDYKGVYQAINNSFARYATEGYTIINREQDMDEVGLRQAKETYKPIGFIEKNRLVISI